MSTPDADADRIKQIEQELQAEKNKLEEKKAQKTTSGNNRLPGDPIGWGKFIFSSLIVVTFIVLIFVAVYQDSQLTNGEESGHTPVLVQNWNDLQGIFLLAVGSALTVLGITVGQQQGAQKEKQEERQKIREKDLQQAKESTVQKQTELDTEKEKTKQKEAEVKEKEAGVQLVKTSDVEARLKEIEKKLEEIMKKL